ncbi:DMT family transporter [Streptomyces sp. LaPpAH-108]|uniref:DMT family transporter n=1 Tax=Streptomyces sp. LaPpAH-108 TaxID=1155714 RepID=UPI0003732936|nr:DMT family transporter [Streptomyces sp. LaPpAH-108]
MPTAPATPGSRRAWLTDGPVLLVAVVWGSSYLATKNITREDTVITLLLLRFVVAVPLLGLVARRALRRLTVREVCGGGVLGLILAAIFLLETYGVVHTSATNAGLIISLTMVFTPLAEAALNRTPPSRSFLAAAALSLLGVALLTQGTGFTAPSLGDLLMLLAAVARTVNVLVIHRLPAVRDTDDAALTFVQLSTAVAVFALLTPLGGTPPWNLAASFTGAQWINLLYLSLMCTLFAFFVQLWAVRRSSPSRVSLLQGTEPLWAAVIGVALGGDEPGVLGYLGAVLVLAGTTWGRRAAEERPVTDVRAQPEGADIREDVNVRAPSRGGTVEEQPSGA